MITQHTHTSIFFTLFQINDLPFLKKKSTTTGDGFDNYGNDNKGNNRWNKFPYTLLYAAPYVFVALVILAVLFAFNDYMEKSLLQTLKQKAYQGLTPQEHADLCELLAKYEGIHLTDAECMQAGNWYVANHQQLTEAERKVKIEQLPLVNGEKIINAKDASTFVTTQSGFNVFIKENGFPDFTPFSVKNVQIEGMTGVRQSDFTKANTKAGFGTTYDAHLKFNNGKFKDYTWHHHEDTKTMQLVPKTLNNPRYEGLSHTGGAAVCRHNSNFPDKKLEFPSPILEK